MHNRPDSKGDRIENDTPSRFFLFHFIYHLLPVPIISLILQYSVTLTFCSFFISHHEMPSYLLCSVLWKQALQEKATEKGTWVPHDIICTSLRRTFSTAHQPASQRPLLHSHHLVTVSTFPTSRNSRLILPRPSFRQGSIYILEKTKQGNYFYQI